MKLLIILLLTLPCLAKSETICDGTDEITCNIKLPTVSSKRTKVDTEIFPVAESFTINKGEKNSNTRTTYIKNLSLEIAGPDVAKKINGNYEKIECEVKDIKGKINNDLSQFKIGENGLSAKDIELKKEDLKIHDIYSFSANVVCKVYWYEPINKEEIKNYQCMEAQKCLSYAKTMNELKKAEKFRNIMCGSTDTIFSVGDSKRDSKNNDTSTSLGSLEEKASPR